MYESVDDPQAPSAGASSRGLFAWAVYDWSSNAFVTVIQTFVFAAYFTRQVAATPERGGALWGYTISVSGLLVALTAPLLGAAADHYGPRKVALAIFTGICVAAMGFLWFVRPSPGYTGLAMGLIAVGMVAYELATVLYDAMLPKLASPDRIGRWSGWGWAMGYSGGLLCLVACLVVLHVATGAIAPLADDSAAAVRATFPVAALWYLVFALPLFFVTPDAPATGKSLRHAIGAGLRQLLESFRNVRCYSHIVRFLIARMMYVNGLITLFVFGGVYAAAMFDMSTQRIILFGIALNVTAGLGAAVFAWVDDWVGSNPVIIGSLCSLLAFGTVMLLVGSQLLFWIMGLILGLFVGPVQAASRSWLARTAPEPVRNQMFGFYALSGKATAFVGPFLVGVVTQWTQSQRLGMSVILVLFAGGLGVFLTVPRTDAA